MKCLEKDRTRRYATATGLCADIQRHLADEPVHACPPSGTYRLKTFVRRHKTAVLTSSAIAAALLAGLIVASIGMVQARRQAAIAQAMAIRADREASNAETQAARSEQVARILKDMLDGAGPAVARGRDTTLLREIVDNAAERIGSELKDQPLVEADLRTTIGNVYHLTGDFAQAERMHKQALVLRRDVLGPQNPDVVSSLSTWAYALWEAGQHDEAEKVGREALALQRKVLGNDHLELAATLNNLGYELSLRGKLSEGEAMLREALAIRSKQLRSDDARLATTLSFLGANLWRQNKLNEAEARCREAIAIERKALGDVHPQLASSLGRLAHVLRAEGRLSESEEFRRQSLSIRRAVHPPYHFQVIHEMEFLTDLLLEEGKLNEAQANCREMIDILRNAVDSGINKPEVLNTLAWQLVTSHFPPLYDPAKAVKLARQAIAASPKNGNFWNTLGVALYRAGDWRGALESLDQSIALRGGGDPEDWFVQAMAYWQLGNRFKAREMFDKAALWTDQNQHQIDGPRRFRKEAAELLGIPQTRPSTVPATGR